MADEGNARRLESASLAAVPTRSRLGALARIFERLAPHLAVASALLFLLGAWAPWVNVVQQYSTPDGSGTFQSTIAGSDLGVYALVIGLHLRPANLEGALFYWSLTLLILVLDALPFLGILLTLALWQRRSRGVVRLCAGYLVLASLSVVIGIYSAVSGLVLPCSGACLGQHWSFAWGLWLAMLALALGWLALVLFWQRGVEKGATPEGRSRVALAGAVAFTLGWFIWMLALILLPWLTAGCMGVPLSLTHFARGACMGYDGYDMLTDALQNGSLSTLFGPTLGYGIVPLHIIEFVAATGAIVALLLWRRRVRSLRLPVVLWLALASAVFALCWQGTSLHLAHGGTVVYTTAPLVIGPAVAVTVVALLLGWAGGVAIWLHKR